MKKKISIVLFTFVMLFGIRPVLADPVSAPKITNLETPRPGTLKVTFQDDGQADEYEIQYSQNQNMSKAQTQKVKKGVSALEIQDLVPGKNYFVQIRSYFAASDSYSEWSSAMKKKVKKGTTIVNVQAAAAIEADIKLSGSGTGYHAKLVIGSANVDAAVSFGIQYDAYASAPYTGKAMALVENIATNAPGGQAYDRPGNKSLKVGKTYHYMVTIDKKGKVAVYLDYKKIGTFSNPRLSKGDVYLRLEACARLNGDKVNAVFDHIKFRKGKKYEPNRGWNGEPNGESHNSGLKCKNLSTETNRKAKVSGTIKGLPPGGDWDSRYEDVSGFFQVQ